MKLSEEWTANSAASNLLDSWSIKPFTHLLKPVSYLLICIIQLMLHCISVVNDSDTATAERH